MMNEMASGCCVCSDERGWAENPLVYCDGAGCNIGVHKACYGIVTVPSGNWYCRKCESQERSARVRCELCPSKEGALKRTDNGGWAHVVCGLYIPEVRFASVTTMEPIVLSQIPTERYNKVCYICEQNNRGTKASQGACMPCNKTGCKNQFHVTCAQALGLLCEEPGNYLDNVKYCGYCQDHYMKLKKGSVKAIPAFKPLTSNNSCSDDSPEKKIPNYSQTPADLKQSTKRKSITNRVANLNGPPRTSMADRKEPYTQSSSVDQLNGNHNANTPSASQQQSATKERTPVSSSGDAVATVTNTTSVVTPLPIKNENNSRFTTSNFVESVITPSEIVFGDMQKSKKRKFSEVSVSLPSELSVSLPNMNVSTVVIKSTPSTPPQPQPQSLVSPKRPEVESSSSKLGAAEEDNNGEEDDDDDDDDDDDSSSVLKFIEEPNLSAIKSESNSSPGVARTCTPPVSTSGNSVISSMAPTTTYSSAGSTVAAGSVASTSHTTTPSLQVTKSAVTSVNAGARSTPTSTNSSSSYLTPVTTASETKASKFQNNSNVPHMLGNRLNPSSSMAQKMFDSLNDEMEAHSIFTTADTASNVNNFVGPPLYNKIISSTRAKEASKRSNSPSSNGGGPLASLSGSAANFPQSLEELLEKQWEQGGTFLMEQAQHFDIASLLTCLHKLREENLELEEHIRKLKARRDHLLGVNARLAMPLAPISQPVNNIHASSQTTPQHATVQHPPMSQSIPQQQQQQHHVPHSQPYQQTNPAMSMNSMPDSNQLRNIPLPSSVYGSASVASTTLRGPHGSVYQNPHSMENGLMPQSHHQHSRAGISSLSNSGNISRHHGPSPNPPMFVPSQQQQSSNPGVVVRAPNIPVSEMSLGDRRSWRPKC